MNNYGGLSSLSHNQGTQNYPNSAGGFYRGVDTLSSALQKSNNSNQENPLVDNLDFGEYLNHSKYLMGQALLSPRHIRDAVLKYDRQFNMRDLRWSEFSIIQKMLYLFENQRQIDREAYSAPPIRNGMALVQPRTMGAGTSMRIETNGVISESTGSNNVRASTSLNHRTSRLTTNN